MDTGCAVSKQPGSHGTHLELLERVDAVIVQPAVAPLCVCANLHITTTTLLRLETMHVPGAQAVTATNLEFQQSQLWQVDQRIR